MDKSKQIYVPRAPMSLIFEGQFPQIKAPKIPSEVATCNVGFLEQHVQTSDPPVYGRPNQQQK